MDMCWLLVVVMVVAPICEGWRSSSEEDRRQDNLRIHNHKKRHMLPTDTRTTASQQQSIRSRETRKQLKTKPTGHLTPLKDDDMDNDEVVSVAIGPPPMRPLYDKPNWKKKNLTVTGEPDSTTNFNGAASLVKEVLTQIGREFLTHQINENFVFGQYVGQAMKNITSELKLQFQHDILELIIKYQKLGEQKVEINSPIPIPIPVIKEMKETPKLRGLTNDTEDNWPDFSNIARLVG